MGMTTSASSWRPIHTDDVSFPQNAQAIRGGRGRGGHASLGTTPVDYLISYSLPSTDSFRTQRPSGRRHAVQVD